MPELDALRGTAAAAVLVHHALRLYGPPHLGPDPLLLRLHYVLMHHTPMRVLETGRGPVLLFFVLSGYVLARALLRRGSPGLLAYAAQRSVRLLLPVAAAVLLSAALLVLFYNPALLPLLDARGLGMWLRLPTAADILRNITLVGADPDLTLDFVLWSLVHEWRLTLLMPLVLSFRGRPWVLVTLAALAMATGLAAGAGENTVLLGRHLLSSVPATLYFLPGIATGAALALAGPLPCLSMEQRLAAGLTAAALFSMASDLAVYAGSVLLILLAQQSPRLREALLHPWLLWLGRISFSLYLVHLPLLLAALSLLYGRMPLGPVLSLGVLISFPVASVFHGLVEAPARRLAHQAERRLRRPG